MAGDRGTGLAHSVSIALNMVWVGFIETFKRALGSALALLWGRLLFSEEVHPTQLAAVALMGLGVGLVVW